MKFCNKCKQEKPITDFWKDKSTKNGMKYTCISCNQVYQESKAKKLYQKRYIKTEAFKESHLRTINKYPEKRKALDNLNNAVQLGTIKKLNYCSNCNSKSKRIEGHHYDYSKPLDVVWLCVKCHKKIHKELKIA